MRDEEEVGPAFGSGLRSSGSGSSSRRGSSPARSWVDAAVKGTPYVPRDQRGPGINTATSTGPDGMPVIGNYSLLPEDPSPEPEGLPSLLTWGTLMSTPRALEGNADSGDPLDATPSFRLPNTKRRDEIARKLGDKASRAMHERAKGFTPKPRYTSGSSGGGSRGAGGLSETLRAAAERSRGRTPSRTPGSVRGGGGSMAPPAMTPKRSDLSSAGKRLLERSLGRTPGTASSGLNGLSGVKRALGSTAEGRAGWTPQ
jgi:protein DGCR14